MFTHITDTPPVPEDHGPSQEPLLATPTPEEREHMTRTQTLGVISFHEHERPSLGGIQPQLDHLLPGRSRRAAA